MAKKEYEAVEDRNEDTGEIVKKTVEKAHSTFWSTYRRIGDGTEKYVVLAKMHTQHMVEAIAYNLYRSLGSIVSKFPLFLQWSHFTSSKINSIVHQWITNRWYKYVA